MSGRNRSLARAGLGALALGVALAAWAGARGHAEPDAGTHVLAQSPSADDGWAEGGVEACTKCHDQTEARPISAILQTRHATAGDPRTPFGSERGCQSCHGRSGAHVKKPADGEARAPVEIRFGREAPVEPQNAQCLSCHQGGERMHWKGSAHDAHQVACASCHRMHVADDPMLETGDEHPETWRRAQADACFQCHPQQRAQIHRISSHPFKEGKMRCSDCHNPHGSMGDFLLARPNVNETCYVCHADKRGPFLWEHAPAREDCSICHEPHGSNHPTLLRTRGPRLCQQCHQAAFHPSTAYTAAGLPGPTPADQLLLRNCLNCHTEVHGSNHPSGPRFTR
jgi:DmsE family decaheme c-type cytochrome